MSKLRSAFGQKIRAIRKSQKISQEALAERCGLHYTYIGAVERGECNLSFDNIEKISKALGVPIGELFTLPEAQDPASPEAALQAEILGALRERPEDEVKLGLQVLRDVMGWLGKESVKPKRRKRRKQAPAQP